MKPATMQKTLLIIHIYDLSLSTIMAVGEVQDVFLDPLVKSFKPWRLLYLWL